MTMNDVLKSKLENLPDNPGVYQFFNDKGKHLYIGKAKNLKNRVRTYFSPEHTSVRIGIMVKKIHDIQLIVTDSELEALVLENNLIKQYKPRYNVLLKDDKSFPFIKVTAEDFPRIYATRNLVKDGSRYFGPYTDIKSMRYALRLINQLFKIRSCKYPMTPESIANKKVRVCLDYHIKKCDGPCEGLISRDDYNIMVEGAVKLLGGKLTDLLKELNEGMVKASSDLDFELAALYRDNMQKLQVFADKQKVVSDDFEDRDIIAVATADKDATCSILNIRGGKLIGKKQIGLRVELDSPLEEVYASFIKLFYDSEYVVVPAEIVTEVLPADDEIIQSWISEKAQQKVKFFVPQRGKLKSLVNMCKQNAILQLGELQLQRMKREGNIPHILTALKRDIPLKKLPRRIECFDISNLQGSDIVASMVVFVDGKPKKSEYRRYIIEGIIGPDDFASMHQVVSRRYTRVIKEGLQFPDLIMIDGGKGQLSSAVDALKEITSIQYEMIGLAKRLEEIFIPEDSEPIIIPLTSSSLKLLQQVRDEAHRFAITFHRERRSKRIITSELLSVKGIGPALTAKLLKEFGSVDAIRTVEKERLAEIIGEKKAGILISYFSDNG
jgi:excinuclease ABC subunit C